MTRRAWARAAVAADATAALALAYMVFESQWLRLVEHEVSAAGLPPDLDGFTVLQLSDLHAGSRPSLNLRVARKAVALAAAARPDLIVITGDLVTGPSRLPQLGTLLSDLGGLPGCRGVFAVLGNHDHGDVKVVRVPPVDLADLRSTLDDAGVRLLTNECVSVAVGEAAVQVCGVDDLRLGHGDLDAVAEALDRSPGTLRLLLSHYGDVARRLAPGDVALVLSGDTHGGQICVPTPHGPVPLSSPAAAYRSGFYDVGGVRLFVSVGVGTSFLPFRFFCRPQVDLFRFRPA